MNSISKKWESFKNNVIPKDAPDIQIQEIEISFYAGAFTFVSLALEISLHSDDAGDEMMNGLYDEIKLFIETY